LHEARITRATSVNVTKMMCQALSVPFLDHSSFALFTVKGYRAKHDFYFTHGSSGARLPHSKIRICTDLFRAVNSRVLCMGHVHELCHITQLYREVEKATGRLVEKERSAIICGHYLGYGGYSERFDLPPSRTGSPIINLHGNGEIRVVI